MENYLEYRLSKVAARMKPDVVPHIFTCQPDKRKNEPRVGSEKRAKKRKISNILTESECLIPKDISKADDQKPSTSYQAETKEIFLQTSTFDFGCQANPIHYRSKATQVSMELKITVKDTAISPIKFTVPKQSKNIVQKTTQKCLYSDSDSSVEKEIPNLNIWQPQDSSDTSEAIEDKQQKQITFRNHFIDMIQEKLRMYTGIPKENQGIIDIVEQKCNLKRHFIYLTLYKIKTNDSFEKIGDLFGLSKTYASKIFHNTSIVVAHFFRKLIFWPVEDSIRRNLPIQFRITFSKVQSIIDCLEIEIQKPSSAKQQALTWSEYKKCNTVKYLISTTPDGLINFVSKGYGGRTSDAVIFENSGFLNKLPESSAVMADRGFKKIESFLNKKKCSLVRPPSVVSKEIMTKDDVLLTKRIASVRIHIERIIKRVRDFKMLSPHATVNLDLVQKLDDIIVIACAIINLQKPIINQ